MGHWVKVILTALLVCVLWFAAWMGALVGSFLYLYYCSPYPLASVPCDSTNPKIASLIFAEVVLVLLVALAAYSLYKVLSSPRSR